MNSIYINDKREGETKEYSCGGQLSTIDYYVSDNLIEYRYYIGIINL